MPLNSVQTNPGASTAIRALADAAGELAATRGRLSTGLRVASARHSSSSWTIAQQQRGDIGAFGSVLTSLQRGQSITTVALAAAETVVDLLSEMRSQALAATDSALTDAQRSACNSGFLALRDRIACTVRDAVFDGVNLLDGSSASESVLAGLPQTTSFTVTVPGGGNGGGNGGGKGGDGGGNGGGAGGGGNGGGAGGGKGGGGPKKPAAVGPMLQAAAPAKAAAPFPTTTTIDVAEPGRIELRTASLTLGGPNVTVDLSTNLFTAAEAAEALSQVETSLRNLTLATASLGTDANRVDRQITFIGKVRDQLQIGVGALVDADMGRETARLRALQAREMLAANAAAIANAAPGVLLGLFRN